jgi:hypothetical protein
MVKAVSLRLFSIAIAWRVSSGSQASSGIDRGGIAGKGPVGEGVDLDEPELGHFFPF